MAAILQSIISYHIIATRPVRLLMLRVCNEMIGIPDYSKATSLLCEDVVRVKHRADFAALGVEIGDRVF